MGELGNYYHNRYDAGNRAVIGALAAEEANLLYARALARSNGWWDPVASTMQGLQVLYEHTGRDAEWSRLVEEIVPDFVDPRTDVPGLGLKSDINVIYHDGRNLHCGFHVQKPVQIQRITALAASANRSSRMNPAPTEIRASCNVIGSH